MKSPTKSMTELTDYIEVIRREAFDEGNATAMRAVIEFTGNLNRPVFPRPVTRGNRVTVKASPPPASARRRRSATTPAVRRARAAIRPKRGDNARHVAEALTTLPERTGPAAAIKKALASAGHDLAYTSIRHALGQLQTRGKATVAADGKTWSYVDVAA